MSILKIKDLVHKYVTYGDTEEDKQEIAAIDHIDINVEKGEFVAILGKNGSGKSSLAKHINGLLMPTKGTVYIKGMDTKDESTLLKVRQSAGIVFQNPDNQIVGTTVEEDTAFGPENLGIASKDIWTRITAALTGVGMIAYKEASPNHFWRTETESSDRRDHGNGTRMYRVRRTNSHARSRRPQTCFISCESTE